MAIQSLNKAQAFNPGCDLWIIPNEIGNPLYEKMDWYLNFQLTQTYARKPQDLSSQISFFITENQLPHYTTSLSAKSPVLVYAENGLPTKNLIAVPIEKDESTWIEKVFHILVGLNRPTTRIFLPQTMGFDDLKKYWKGSSHDDIQVVGK